MPSHILLPREVLAAEILGPGTSGIEYPVLIELGDGVLVVSAGVVGVSVEVEEHGAYPTSTGSGAVSDYSASDIAWDPLHLHAGDGILFVLPVGVCPAVS